MSQGSSLQNFADFWLATAGERMTEPGELESQASQYRTYLYPLMLKGLTQKKIIQAGRKIEDYVQLSYTNSMIDFDASDTFEYGATDSLTEIEVPWRFRMVSSVVNEAEID